VHRAEPRPERLQELPAQVLEAVVIAAADAGAVMAALIELLDHEMLAQPVTGAHVGITSLRLAQLAFIASDFLALASGECFL
jgi:hypothetical protein